MSITRRKNEYPLYVVMCMYRAGPEAVIEPGKSIRSIVRDLVDAQIEYPQYVLEVRDGVERDISDEVARTVVGLAEQNGEDLTHDVILFCQEYDALPVDCSAFERGRVVRSEAA